MKVVIFWLGKLAITQALGIRQGRGGDKEILDHFTEECIAYDKLPVKDAAEAATARNCARHISSRALLKV